VVVEVGTLNLPESRRTSGIVDRLVGARTRILLALLATSHAI